jgi:hypothetical protein
VTIEDAVAETYLGRLDARELLGDILVPWVRDTVLPRFEPCFV